MFFNKNLLTIGFSPHRTETLRFAKKLMQEHDIIILEEPPNPYFPKILAKKITLEEYLKHTNLGFPVFAKNLIKILQKFYNTGKKIFQIEPYLEKVMCIYEKLENGESPEEIFKDPELKEVYQIEHKATGLLLRFYELSLTKHFEKIVEAVKNFSRIDAERFRLRDSLRARAILKILPEKGAVYVEAGTIHIYLKKLLHKWINKNWKIQHKFLLGSEIKKLTGKPYLVHPGEFLTLRYIFKCKSDEKLENLLAARSLIYIKLVPKEELVPDEREKFPHLKHEVKIINMVNRLTFTDCARLYKKLIFVRDNKEAIKIVENFLN